MAAGGKTPRRSQLPDLRQKAGFRPKMSVRLITDGAVYKIQIKEEGSEEWQDRLREWNLPDAINAYMHEKASIKGDWKVMIEEEVI